MLLKSRASQTCFRACFLPGRAKDLSAPRYNVTNIQLGVLHSLKLRSSEIAVGGSKTLAVAYQTTVCQKKLF